jgi:pilus assembly protein CpaB
VSRRTRGLALLGAAAACAGLAASSVSRYTNQVRAQVGPSVSVLTARADLARGTAITPDLARRALEERSVPVRFVPPQAATSLSEAIGQRLAVGLHRGDYLSRASFTGVARRSAGEESSGRLIELSVAGTGSLADMLRPGTRVDVLITTDGGSGGARTYLALQAAELVAFSGGGGVAGDAKASATLRVSLRQAVLLTAAQNFAREVRLVPRPPGNAGRLGAVGVSAAGFGR